MSCSLMVSITIPRPSILSPFLGSQDTAAYTSASIEHSAMSLRINLHASYVSPDISLAFVVATEMTLLVHFGVDELPG